MGQRLQDKASCGSVFAKHGLVAGKFELPRDSNGLIPAITEQMDATGWVGGAHIESIAYAQAYAIYEGRRLDSRMRRISSMRWARSFSRPSWVGK